MVFLFHMTFNTIYLGVVLLGKQALIRLWETRTVIIYYSQPSIHRFTPHPQPHLRPLIQPSPLLVKASHEVVMMFSWVRLQNAPPGGALSPREAVVVHAQRHYSPSMRSASYPLWMERPPGCTVSERDRWLMQSHGHLLLGKVALRLHTKKKKKTFSVA